MATLDPTIVAQLKRDGLLREGHFAFRSGRHSAGLLNRDLLLADPSFASHMGYAIAKRFFTDHLDTIAAPSIWGAGLAQWVGYFLDPKAKIVYATPKNGEATIAENLGGLIHGQRVLLIDNLIISGATMSRFAAAVDGLGATVVGIATLWNSASPEIAGHPVFGLLNTLYDAYPQGQCPLCAAGGLPPEAVGY